MFLQCLVFWKITFYGVFCYCLICAISDREKITIRFLIEALESHHLVDKRLVCKVKRCWDTFCGELKSLIEDSWPSCWHFLDYLVLIEVLCVKAQQDEKCGEETPEQSEKMHSKLVPHRPRVPSDSLPDDSLAPSDAIYIVSLLSRLVPNAFAIKHLFIYMIF